MKKLFLYSLSLAILLTLGTSCSEDIDILEETANMPANIVTPNVSKERLHSIEQASTLFQTLIRAEITGNSYTLYMEDGEIIAQENKTLSKDEQEPLSLD